MVDQPSPVTTSEQQAVPVAQSPVSIWLSPICDDTADHGDGRTWASPAPEATCEDCGLPWVEYVRADLSLPCKSGEGAGEAFLDQLRRVNLARYEAWVEGADAGIMFDALELGGEVGELLNVVKKLEREERGWRGSRASPEDFADECADVLICLDKLARRKGVNLAAATIAKFNATSEKAGLPHRLSTPDATQTREAGFLAAIHERTPTGGWIAVQHQPDGDWSVAEHPLPWLPGGEVAVTQTREAELVAALKEARETFQQIAAALREHDAGGLAQVIAVAELTETGCVAALSDREPA